MQSSFEKQIIQDSYNYCKNITYNHYENFPVASKLLPKKIRKPIIAIYTYARYADDIVDSPDLDNKTKFDKAKKLYDIVSNLEKTNYNEINELTKTDKDLNFLAHLKISIKEFNISKSLLLDLLKAFKQDITKEYYRDLNDLLSYCKYSADPIGRLLLNLNKVKKAEALKASDAVCTALQIINFMQDIKSDYNERNRCYIPLDALKKYNLNIPDINSAKPNVNWINARNDILNYCENLILNNQQTLIDNLSGRFKLEIKAIIYSALLLIKKFKETKFKENNIFQRPYLSKFDFMKIFMKTLLS